MQAADLQVAPSRATRRTAPSRKRDFRLFSSSETNKMMRFSITVCRKGQEGNPRACFWLRREVARCPSEKTQADLESGTSAPRHCDGSNVGFGGDGSHLPKCRCEGRLGGSVR